MRIPARKGRLHNNKSTQEILMEIKLQIFQTKKFAASLFYF